MRRIVFLAICFTLMAGRLFGQTTIDGHVLDTQGNPLGNITVLVQNPSDSTILAFGSTSQKGYYSVSLYATSLSKILVSISGLEIKPMGKQLENKSQTVDFSAEFNVMQINEVVVKANKVWQERDTINYLVSSFTSASDLAIGDVIKKLPGLSVSEGGSIKYRGREINKLYIENMDLLKGRYGIATKNLQAKDISVVQVIENHQPIKMMEGIEMSHEAAINLKLKEGAKNIFTLQALLGAGYADKLLWQEELVGTLFNRTNQNITTVKSSNTGDASSAEIPELSSINEIGTLAMADVITPSSPPLRKNRYSDQTAHSIGSNQLFKLKNNAELTLNVQFVNSLDQLRSYAYTAYNIPNAGIVVIEEDASAQLRKNTLKGGISYTLNQDHYFVGNETKFTADWVENVGQLVGKEEVVQRLQSKSLALFNSTQWGRRNEANKGFVIQFDNAYRIQPHSLYVHPDLFPETMNGGEEYQSTRQGIRRGAFTSALEVKSISAFSLGMIKIDPLFSLKFEHETLVSDILKNSTVRLRDHAQWSNDMSALFFNGSLGANLRYKRNNLSIALGLPFSYRYTHIGHRGEMQDNTNHQTIKFLPNINITDRYRNLQWEVSAALQNFTPRIESLYKGYIFQNYRTLNRYTSKVFDTNTLYTSGSLGYKVVDKMLFLNSALSYKRIWGNGILSPSFDDQLSVFEFVEFPNRSDGLSVSLEASKGFYLKNLIISLLGYWSTSRSDILRQGISAQYFGKGYGLRSRVSMAPFDWLVTDYVIHWNSNSGSDTSGGFFDTIHSIDQSLSLLFDIAPGLSLSAKGEHYYNSFTPGTRHFFLADLSMIYSTKKVRYQLDWGNIFNTATFSTFKYGPMSTFYSLYHIRPSSILLTLRFKVL